MSDGCPTCQDTAQKTCFVSVPSWHSCDIQRWLNMEDGQGLLVSALSREWMCCQYSLWNLCVCNFPGTLKQALEICRIQTVSGTLSSRPQQTTPQKVQSWHWKLVANWPSGPTTASVATEGLICLCRLAPAAESLPGFPLSSTPELQDVQDPGSALDSHKTHSVLAWKSAWTEAWWAGSWGSHQAATGNTNTCDCCGCIMPAGP